MGCRHESVSRLHRLLQIAAIALLLPLLATCGDSQSTTDRDAQWLEEWESASDIVYLDPAQIVGEVSGDQEYLFGSVTSIATDRDGRIYVGDGIGATVRAFDRDASFLAWVAREGGGPGEILQSPADLHLGFDGRLYVRDGARVTVFSRRAGGAIADSVVEIWSTGMGNLTSSRSAMDRTGRYFYPGGHWPREGSPRFFYISYTDGQEDGDTLEVPGYEGLRGLRPAFYSLGGDGLLLRGLNRVPFSAVPVWHVTAEGTLLSSDGMSSQLVETDLTGDTLRVLRLAGRRSRSIPSSERSDSLGALEDRIAEAEERIASFGGRLRDVVGLGEGVLEHNLPDSLPSIIGLTVAQDGSIWVERWPPEGRDDSRYYDVFDSSGRFQKSVVLRAPLVRDPSPWFGERSIAGILRHADTGVERVVRFDVP